MSIWDLRVGATLVKFDSCDDGDDAWINPGFVVSVHGTPTGDNTLIKLGWYEVRVRGNVDETLNALAPVSTPYLDKLGL